MNRRALAFHEAGHAVAAHRLGWPVRLVTIIADTAPDGTERAGHVAFVRWPENAGLPARKRRMQEDMVILLAGPAAQRREFPRSRVPYCGSHDRAEAERLAYLLASSPAGERALLSYAKAEARALVEAEAIAIRAVAIALEEYSTLTGETLAGIVDVVDATRAAMTEADLAAHGLPSVEEAERHRAERQRQARTVTRAHIAEAVLRAALGQIAIGDQHPLTFDALDEAARRHAEARGLDPDKAAARLRSLLRQQTNAARWRPAAAEITGAIH